MRESIPVTAGPGLNVEHTETGTIISLRKQVIAAAASVTAVKAFQITEADPQSFSQDTHDNPTQWVYEVEEMQKIAAGYGQWRPLAREDGGYIGSGYNWLEDSNKRIAFGEKGAGGGSFTSTSIFQNGVDHSADDYPATWKMQPLLTFTIHPGIIIEVPKAETLKETVEECWLFPYSGEDGTCE